MKIPSSIEDYKNTIAEELCAEFGDERLAKYDRNEIIDYLVEELAKAHMNVMLALSHSIESGK